MIFRVSAAACAVAVAAMLTAPVQSSARGGAAAMGHVGGFHPPVSLFNHVRPPVAHPPLAHAHRAPLLRRDFNGRHAFGAAARRNNRGTVEYLDLGGYSGPLTNSGDGTFYGSYYDPSDMSGWIYPPLPKVPPAAVVPVAGRDPVVVDRGACRSETVAVPTPGAAERRVTITRC
jgi:hypothetical protein